MFFMWQSGLKNPFWKIEPRGFNGADTVFIGCQMFTLVYQWHLVLQSYRYFTEYLFASDRAYSTALVGVCDSGLAGLIILLISSAISGFLFTTLVWCNSHTWIYFKHKGRYIKVSHCIYYNILHVMRLALCHKHM